MDTSTEQRETDKAAVNSADPARLMADIRRRLSAESGPAPCVGQTRDLTETVNNANVKYADARQTAHAPGGPIPEELDVLGRTPGHSRGWLSPKRWYCAVHRLFFGRQERFNVAVARWLASVPQQDAALLGTIDAVGYLVGSVNLLTRRVQELGNVESVLQDVLGLGRSLATKAEELERRLGELDRDYAQRLERLDGEHSARFEQLDRKNSVQLEDVRDRTGAAISVMSDRLRLAEREVGALRAGVGELNDRIHAMLSGKALPVRSVPPYGGNLPSSVDVPEFDFLAFEASTRGTEGHISAEQQKYLRWFAGADAVLDAGCGRGEFLEILREAGVGARGIDTDPRMVEHCRSKGLDVEQAALFDYLQSVPDDSLGGLFLGQVVEHLPTDALLALPSLVLRKLRPGAYFAAETINPTCLTTFSGAFYADPTHVKPVHPEALKFLLSSAGFSDIDVQFSAPVPAADSLAPLREAEPVTPAVKDVLLQANANFARLNSVLYGYANYAMAGRKPGA